MTFWAQPRVPQWTEAMVVEAIQTFHARYDRPPAIADFHPAIARSQGHDWRAERFYADGDYPNRRQVVKVFGSWNAALRAAGFQPCGPGAYPRRPRYARQGPRAVHLDPERV